MFTKVHKGTHLYTKVLGPLVDGWRAFCGVWLALVDGCLTHDEYLATLGVHFLMFLQLFAAKSALFCI